jgi:hypothetical protein
MTKQEVKDIIIEMVNSGEITVNVFKDISHCGEEDHGASLLSDMEVYAELEVLS